MLKKCQHSLFTINFWYIFKQCPATSIYTGKPSRLSKFYIRHCPFQGRLPFKVLITLQIFYAISFTLTVRPSPHMAELISKQLYLTVPATDSPGYHSRFAVIFCQNSIRWSVLFWEWVLVQWRTRQPTSSSTAPWGPSSRRFSPELPPGSLIG